MIDVRSRCGLTVLLVCVSAVLVVTAAQTGRPASPDAPHDTVGPARCVRCHATEAAWWVDVDGPPPHGHVSALTQLETPDARRYAARLNMSDIFEPTGSCVTCHATVIRGTARDGVSCESCHGPGSAYLEVHAKPGAYRLGVAKGLADISGKPAAWARRCVSCHVIAEPTLLRAGHSSGRDFDLAKAFAIVAKHWKHKYRTDDIAAAGREAVAAAGTK